MDGGKDALREDGADWSDSVCVYTQLYCCCMFTVYNLRLILERDQGKKCHRHVIKLCHQYPTNMHMHIHKHYTVWQRERGRAVCTAFVCVCFPFSNVLIHLSEQTSI